MDISNITRIPDPRLKVRGALREVVRDIDNVPQLRWRLRLEGWHFDHRAELPFVVVGEVVSDVVDIANDGSSASAYFSSPVPPAKRVSFGYGTTVEWDFPVSTRRRPSRLDRARLPANVLDPFG